MDQRIQESFVFSAAVILFIAAAAKFATAFGDVSMLDKLDPLLFLSNRNVLKLVGGTELALSAFLLLSKNSHLKLILIAWLATTFLAYRIGLQWSAAPYFCNCLGNWNEKLFVSSRLLNWLSLTFLGWLLGGSYLLLLKNLIKNHKKVALATPVEV